MEDPWLEPRDRSLSSISTAGKLLEAGSPEARAAAEQEAQEQAAMSQFQQAIREAASGAGTMGSYSNIDTEARIRDIFGPGLKQAGEFLESRGKEQGFDIAAREAFEARAENLAKSARGRAALLRTDIDEDPSEYEQELGESRMTPEERRWEKNAITLSGLGSLIAGATQGGDIAEGLSPLTEKVLSLSRRQKSEDIDLSRQLEQLETAREDRNFELTAQALVQDGVASDAVASIVENLANSKRDIALRGQAMEDRMMEIVNRVDVNRGNAAQLDAELKVQLSIANSEIGARRDQAVNKAAADLEAAGEASWSNLITLRDSLQRTLTRLSEEGFSGDDSSGQIRITTEMLEMIDGIIRQRFGDQSGVDSGTSGVGVDINAVDLLRGGRRN
jgi:hypothetical protein